MFVNLIIIILRIFFFIQNNKKAGRKPAINPEIVFEVLSKKKHLIFIGEQLKPVSDKIWTELSLDIQNKMTPIVSTYAFIKTVTDGKIGFVIYVVSKNHRHV